MLSDTVLSNFISFSFPKSIMIFKFNTNTLATHGKKLKMLQYLQPDGLPKNAEQIKKIKKQSMKKSTEEQRAGNHGRENMDKQHTMSRCFPLGTCQQSVCWAEAQVRIPAAVTPWEG